MKFSDKIESMDYSPIRKLVPLANKAEKEGVKVYKLHIGQPDVETPDTFFEGLNNYKEKIIRYSDSRGVPELIDSFVKFYNHLNLNIKNDEILITHGGSEAILFTLMTICNVGDEVLVPEPYYSNYNSFLKMADAELVPIETKIEDEYHLPSKEEIQKKITPKTKAIMFSNPGNPTGTVLTYAEMEMLRDIAIENDLFIISDEVYRQFIYEDIEYKSFLSMKEIEDRVVLVDSISKHYSACGARIGTVVSRNKEFLDNVLKLCQARLCAPTLEQYASSNLINTIETYVDEVKLEYRVRRDLMYNNLSKIPNIKLFKPNSAFYMFVELPVDDTEEFAKWLLQDFRYENQTLMIAPGPGFYLNKELGMKKARLSFCTHNLTDIENGTKILKHALEEYSRIKGG